MDVEARDTESLRRLETAGAVGVAVAGVLVHFAFGWSGESRLVAALGVHSVAVDIASFFVAVAGGQWLSCRILVSARS